jgi:CheY-like chemotaxis protein
MNKFWSPKQPIPANVHHKIFSEPGFNFRPRTIDFRDRMTPTVLLIDDNAVQAATRQTILKRAGYFVIAVLSPERALDQFKNDEFPAPIDLIITDHVMPGLNGSEFVRKVRDFAPDVPVLVISGMEEAEAEYEGLNTHFRLKPLLPDNLLASVHRLVHHPE